MDGEFVVSLWHLILGMAAVGGGFSPFVLAGWRHARSIATWRAEVDRNLALSDGHRKRFDVDDHIRWRAAIDAEVRTVIQANIGHREEHASILTGIGELKTMMAGMDKRLAIVEQYEKKRS